MSKETVDDLVKSSFNETNPGDWDEGRTVVLQMLQSNGLMTAMEFSIIGLIVVGVLFCCWRRPKVTILFMFLWVAWLVSHIVRQTMQHNMEHATTELWVQRKKVVWYSSNLIIALYLCALEWINFLIPFCKDIFNGCEAVWINTQEEYRPFLILALVVIVGLLVAVRQACLHKDATKKGVKEVLCQLSFVFLGPAVYSLLVLMPVEAGTIICALVVSFLPAFLNLHILRVYRSERKKWQDLEDDKPLLGRAGARIKHVFSNADVDQHLPRAYRVARSRLYRLVAFWACWPFLHTFEYLLHHRMLVKEEQLRAAYGVLVAVDLWLLLWHGSYIVPWLFSVIASLCSCCGQLANKIRRNMEKEAAAHVQMFVWGQEFCEKHKVKVLLGAIVVTAILVLMSWVSGQFGGIMQIIAYAVLFFVALDCARCVGRQEEDCCARRAGFWIVVVLWQILCFIPGLGFICQTFSLPIYIAAMLAGELIINLLVSFTSIICGSCLDGLSSWDKHEEEPEEVEKRATESENGVELTKLDGDDAESRSDKANEKAQRSHQAYIEGQASTKPSDGPKPSEGSKPSDGPKPSEGSKPSEGEVKSS